MPISSKRIEELRAMPYEEYRATPEWQERQRNMLTLSSICECCKGDSQLGIYHHTLERLGAEQDSDLLILCATCYEKNQSSRVPDLGFLTKVGWFAGAASLSTIGLEGLLNAPLPAELAALGGAWYLAKKSPVVYAWLRKSLSPDVLALVGIQTPDGKKKPGGLSHWIHAPKEAGLEINPTEAEIKAEVTRTLADTGEVAPRFNGTSVPRGERRVFTLSSVMSQFTLSRDKIYLGTLPNGRNVYCPLSALCHVALAGATDAGKSNIMRMLMAQLCKVGAKVLMLNPHWTGYDLVKQEDWTPFIPYLAHDPIECMKYDVIEHYLKDAATRILPQRLALRAHSRPWGKPIFYVLDELPAIVKHVKDTPKYLDSLLKEGRKVGMYVISAAQDFLVDTIGGTDAVRDCYRTAYSVGGDNTTTKKLLGTVISDEPLGKGTVLLRNATSEYVIEAKTGYVPLVTNEDLYQMLGPTTYVPHEGVQVDINIVAPFSPQPGLSLSPDGPNGHQIERVKGSVGESENLVKPPVRTGESVSPGGETSPAGETLSPEDEQAIIRTAFALQQANGKVTREEIKSALQWNNKKHWIVKAVCDKYGIA